MSTRFTIYCETCEEPGPHIRRHHSGAFLMATDSARLFPEHHADQASDDWGSFLIEHEYHDLRLECERELRLAQEARRREEQKQQETTHRLLPDGSIVPL